MRVTDKDRYGRLVGEVILANGRSLNHELVKAGLAWCVTEAQLAKRGLWSAPHAVAPWEWRKQR